MTKVLIIEDEKLASDRLTRLLSEVISDLEIVGFCDSVKSTVEFLNKELKPDLIISDIQLGDGTSFDVFEQVSVSCPVIFTTAYDEYAIQAFKINSIDYLLKPINKDDLEKSVIKFQALNRKNNLDIQRLLPLFEKEKKIFKKRFVVAIGEKLVFINSVDIAYFCSLEKLSFIVDKQGIYYAMDQSLDKIETLIDPELFFRVSRQYIVSSESIDKILLLSKSRIKLVLKPPTKNEVLVSIVRTHSFRVWLDK